MKKITNKKGFTLAELLIVVAIVSVLVAISIPIFSGKLLKAKLATNDANIRAAKAAAVADYLSDGVNSTKSENGKPDNDPGKYPYITFYDIDQGVIMNKSEAGKTVGTPKDDGIYHVIKVVIDDNDNVSTDPQRIPNVTGKNKVKEYYTDGTTGSLPKPWSNLNHWMINTYLK